MGDVDALSAALRTLVTDAGRRGEIGAAARNRAAELGVGPWFDALVEHWSAMLAGR